MSPVYIQSQQAGNTINPGDHNGVLISVGYWFDPEQVCGIEATGFYLERRGGTFTNTSAFNANENLISTGQSSSVTVLSPRGSRRHADNLPDGPPAPPRDLQRQYQRLHHEPVFRRGAEWPRDMPSHRLSVAEHPGGLPLPPVQRRPEHRSECDAGLVPGDHRNQQHHYPPNGAVPWPAERGYAQPENERCDPHAQQLLRAQTGLEFEAFAGGCFLDIQAKLGLGPVHEAVDIIGTTTFSQPNGPTSVMPGGLLSGPGDVGSHSRDRIAYTSEVNVKLGYEVTHWLRLFVGYDGLSLSNAARPDSQTVISTTNVTATVAGTTNQVTLSQPAFSFTDRTVWRRASTSGSSCVIERRFLASEPGCVSERRNSSLRGPHARLVRRTGAQRSVATAPAARPSRP